MTRHTYVDREAAVRAAVARADNDRDRSLARPTTDPAIQRELAEARTYEHDVHLFATMELPEGTDSAYRDQSLADSERGLAEAQRSLASADGRSIAEIISDAHGQPTRDERVTMRALAAVRREDRVGIDDPQAREMDAAEADRDRQEAAYDLALKELDQARITGGDVAGSAQQVLEAEDQELDAVNRMHDLDDTARRIEAHLEVYDDVHVEVEDGLEP